MAIERVFLGWDGPALVAAAEYLIGRFASPGMLNLAGVIAVLPGGRAARRLSEILVQQADRGKGDRHLLCGAPEGPYRQKVPVPFSAGQSLVPPTIVTVGALPELLYRSPRPLADRWVEQLAWAKALQRVDLSSLKHVLPTAPAEGDLPARLSLGEALARLHRELAGEGLDFAAVAQSGPQVAGSGESARWQGLAQLQKEYLRILDEVELSDQQTARLLAIKRGEPASDARIVLIGVADMNRALRQILDPVAERTTALVFAPPSLADRFDPYGCVRPEAWQDATVALSAGQIEVVGDPAEQAAAAVRAVASLEGRRRPEEITIGVPDRQVVPYLVQQLQQCGMPARDSVGRPLRQTGPCRLLHAAAEYLQGRRFSALAVLARHPAVQAWLDGQSIGTDWLTEMDQFYAEHLPHRLAEAWSPPVRYAGLKKVFDAIENLLRPLGSEPRPLAQWGAAILGILDVLYNPSRLNPAAEPDRTVLAACDKIREVLAGQAAIGPQLTPAVTGIEALHLVLRQVEGETVTPAGASGAVELVGWLELPLDDAPVLVVTGFNEGVVPGSLGADPFLPNPLRRSLRIEDSDRRYARDAYALTALAASRRLLKVIAGRRTVEGDPLTPSRLLFACDERTAARRVLRFFRQEEPCAAADLPGTRRPGQERSAIAVPRPRPLAEPVTSMRVTEFRDYLACPYRYYLRHRLGLESQSDAAVELDDAAFGRLAHAVLKEFGQEGPRRSTDAEKISAWLGDALDRLAAERYGKTPLPAVHVQIEQLRLRLAAFARWQADWARKGWRIERVEASPAEEAALAVDGQPMRLRGQIDRIDVHRSGKRVLFDYKTSDSPAPPDRTHRREGRWVDLQLPLYRHLLPGLGIEGDVDLGYVVLPKDTGRVGHLLAAWTEAQLREADAAAADVVRKVRAEVFWPPASPPPAGFEEFAAICHDDQFAAVLAAEEGGNGA